MDEGLLPHINHQKKGHTEKGNLNVNDIDLVQYTNSICENWRLSRVVEANAGADGKVRDVLIRNETKFKILH